MSSTIMKHRLFWPLVALVALLALNVVFTPTFFSIQVRNGHLYGSLIDIMLYGAPLLVVAIGMTLVIATGGIDLSVGAVVAIAGALACLFISTQPDQNTVSGTLIAVGIALAAAIGLGLWNGVLVAKLGIQPIIATLILMVAGRGIAQLITDGQFITINSGSYHLIGGGYLFTIPFAVILALALVAVTALVTRRSALGLLIEAVGGNAETSRLVGIRAAQVKLMAYAFCAFCAAIAGLMISSNISAADGNSAGLWIELDAILAVVIGGTSLLGGRFYLGGTIVGAAIIQTLSTTINTIGVPPQTTLVFKAVVVIIVCLLQSPQFRAKLFGWRRSRPADSQPTAPAAATPELEASL